MFSGSSTTSCSVSLTFVGHNLVRLQEEGAVLQVHGFTLQLVLHHVDQRQLVAQVLQRHENAELVSLITHSPDSYYYASGLGPVLFPVCNADQTPLLVSALGKQWRDL